MKRAYSFLFVAAVALVMAPFALATHGTQPTHPPTFDVADMEPILYAVGAVLLAGVLALLAPVILTKVPFALVNMARAAIRKFTGRAKPAAG